MKKRKLVAVSFLAAVAAMGIYVQSTVSANDVGSQSVYRFYNSKSGENFYTANNTEYKSLVGNSNWTYEGIGWVAPASSKIPVYRLYNKKSGEHQFTANQATKNSLIKQGWIYEGVGFYSAESKKVPVYRIHNQKVASGLHIYTDDTIERKNLIKDKSVWLDEGVAWSGIKKGNISTATVSEGKSIIATNGTFADPTAISVNDVTYMYSTSIGTKKIPLAIMDRDGGYEIKKDVLNRLPKWAKGSIWAPSVSKFNGKYYLYFSVTDKTTNKFRIGVATSNTPDGTFSVSDEPVTAMDAAGGVIDPSIYIENGTQYLAFKNDGNAVGQASNLYIIKLTAAGSHTTGSSYKMISNLNVENPNPKYKGKAAYTIEAPYLVKAPDNTYVLFFAGNSYAQLDYFTGYATSKSLLGAYKYQNTVFTSEKTNNKIQGPGGTEVLISDKGEKMLYLHGWVNYNKTDSTKRRITYGVPFSWQSGHVPYVNVK
ncbi:family 43 glycosylhydrolase [Lactococcus insecticola]|nr:family 43 glycosylhydrolase [Lactococcus insecticola]